ncbi:hypothetical protein [Burkholderia cenocepacia]|uniref:hypothetical protein n=1 Tax=Burkholderia cenocepacia TaxID=95486 RepID=UPI0028542AE6|nr:hypothetical protein [Burkholderia cenocepacia]MDR8052203.1 hypothetical protein [Burkholderia cenocepacia]
MNDLFIFFSLGSHVLDDATADTSPGEARTLFAFACIATPRYSLCMTNQNNERRCPTRATHVAIARPIAARARSAPCAMTIVSDRLMEIGIAGPTAT